MGAAIVQVTDASFEAEVLRSPLLTITDFWADWCMPCKRIAPILDQIATEYAGKIKIAKVEVDANPHTPARFGITGIPTLLVFRDGMLVETIVGFLPKDKLLEKVLPHLSI
ncbi:MAG: thioredoxin [Anaerolineae bacterium]